MHPRIRTALAAVLTIGALTAGAAVTAAPASALPVAVPCVGDVFIWCGDVRNSSNSDKSMLTTYNWPSGGTRSDLQRLAIGARSVTEKDADGFQVPTGCVGVRDNVLTKPSYGPGWHRVAPGVYATVNLTCSA